MPKLSTLLSSRSARIAAPAVAITALVGGSVAYANADTTVDLSVDGETREVTAFGDTVEDMLEAAEVEVGPRDVVVPALAEQVSDGDDVVVRHAREVTLTVDGETDTYWTTALTVGDALKDLDVRAAGAQLSASRSLGIGREGIELDVVLPKDVTFHAAGKEFPVTTVKPTVGGALKEAGISIDENDKVSLNLTMPVSDGLEVAVTRVDVGQVVQKKAVPAPVERRKSNDLYEGDTKVVQAGKSGERTLTFEEVLEDGKRVSLTKTSDTVTRQPVARVVAVGTKERPAPKRETTRTSRSSSRTSTKSSAPAESTKSSAPAESTKSAAPKAPSTASGSVWDSLARCESGGNWSINTGNGYYGGLQFSASSWRAVGGTGLPHQHSRATQIQMAERLKAIQGWGAWPACTRKLGLR